jgi:tRNA1(Val) A37 N6-methylase TrmN6
MGVTEDAMLGGAVRVRQPADGYRAGLDAGLLAAACEAGRGERVLEAGCGAGAALLAAAVRNPGAKFVGVERDLETLALAQDNIGLNRLGDRVGVLAGDVSLPFSDLGLEPFDAVLANPPFFDDEGALRAPHPKKRASLIAEVGLGAWASFLIAAAREGGLITLIHRADRLADILSHLAPRAGSFQIRPVHPFADASAKRVIVRARRGGKAPLQLLPALVLHDRDGAKHTAQAEAFLRGEAGLAWV